MDAYIFSQLQTFHCLPIEELEWLYSKINQPIITECWNPTAKQDHFSAQIPPQNSQTPVVFKDYYALYPVGAGASGIVYKAWQMNTPNIVALKQRWAEDYQIERFRRELVLWKKLQHPHILPYIDGGEQNGQCFLVTPYIEGGTLEECLQNIPSQRTLETVVPLFGIILQIAEALKYAHQQNVIHRDIKPGNILLQGNHAYLMDFGLAREISYSQTVSITRGAVGTPLYMAPEIWRLQPCPQSDIYSLCVILYEIVSGTYPFNGSDPEEIYFKQLASRYPKPPSISIHLPNGFNNFLLRGLCNDPKGRYTSMADFIEKWITILQYL